MGSGSRKGDRLGQLRVLSDRYKLRVAERYRTPHLLGNWSCDRRISTSSQHNPSYRAMAVAGPPPQLAPETWVPGPIRARARSRFRHHSLALAPGLISQEASADLSLGLIHARNTLRN